MSFRLGWRWAKKPAWTTHTRSFLSSTPRPKTRYIRFSSPDSPGSPKPSWRRNDPKDWRTWDPRVKLLVGSGGVGIAYYLYHQEQVPDTGRWRFMNTSPEEETLLAEKMYLELREELKSRTLPPHHPINRHVRRVVTRLLHASNLGILKGESIPKILSPFGILTDSDGTAWNPDVELGAAKNPGKTYGPDKEWNLLVVNDQKTVNAMAIPGTIVVFTGILPICRDEEGLASVLSHEIGHIVARHTAERISGQTVRFIIAGLLSFVMGIDFGITNTFNTLFLELPNSRTQEREADLIGLRIMSRACYDPAAAPKMFARLAQVESKIAARIGMDFLRTHPSSESRVKLLEDVLPQGYAIMAANPDCEHVRQEIDSFKATARAIKPGERGDWGFDV